MSAITLCDRTDLKILRAVANNQDDGVQAANPSQVRRTMWDLDGLTWYWHLGRLINLGLITESVSGATWHLWLTTAGWNVLSDDDG